MLDLPWRLVGIGLAVLALVALMWRVNTWRNGYLERDAIAAEFAGYKVAVSDREKEAAQEREAAGKRSEALALKLGKAEFQLEQIASKPIESVVYREKPAVNGKCDDPRIGADWFGVWNAAADVASGAVHASD